SARRTSRAAASTSAADSAPRRVSRSRMPESLSDRPSNILALLPLHLAWRRRESALVETPLTPTLSPQGRGEGEEKPPANTNRARGRNALSGGGLRPHGTGRGIGRLRL